MILVTGANSCIGEEVVRQLVMSGMRVKVFHDADDNLSHLRSISDQIDFFQGDILDVTDIYEAVSGVDGVFHCAVIDERTSATYEQRMKYNVEGTANVVNAMLYHQVPKIIFFSTLSALGAEPEKIADENTKSEKNEWTTEQALSFILAEREIWRGSAEGLQVSVINSAEVLSQDLKGSHLLAETVNSLKSGKPDIYPSDIYYVSLKDLIQLSLKIYHQGEWNKRWLAIGGSDTMLHFYQKVSQKYPSEWKPRIMKKSTVFFKVVKDFIISTFSGNNRSYRRVHGKRLMTGLKFDASQTTSAFDIRWTSLEDFLSGKQIN